MRQTELGFKGVYLRTYASGKRYAVIVKEGDKARTLATRATEDATPAEIRAAVVAAYVGAYPDSKLAAFAITQMQLGIGLAKFFEDLYAEGVNIEKVLKAYLNEGREVLIK